MTNISQPYHALSSFKLKSMIHDSIFPCNGDNIVLFQCRLKKNSLSDSEIKNKFDFIHIVETNSVLSGITNRNHIPGNSKY